MKITKIRNESEDIITDLTEIKSIIRVYYEKLYSKKLDNLDETNKFLETQKLPKLFQEEIKNLNRYVTSKVIESVVKNFHQRKVQSLGWPQTAGPPLSPFGPSGVQCGEPFVLGNRMQPQRQLPPHPSHNCTVCGEPGAKPLVGDLFWIRVSNVAEQLPHQYLLKVSP